MTERPILFSDAMVRAILAGTKTITRRVLTPQPIEDSGEPISVGRYHPTVVRRGIEEPGAERFGASTSEQSWPCPYGEPGDRLWAREAWRACVEEPEIDLRADGRSLRRPMHGDDEWWARWRARSAGGRWQPSIYMPRWASRLTLEVTSVRVERVQSISEDDARAEGCSGHDPEPVAEGGAIYAMKGRSSAPSPLAHFRALWDSINGERPGCSLKANPWVWVVGFRRVSL